MTPALMELYPPGCQGLPAPGCRVVWPGDDRVWEWTGERWVSVRVPFDGGDSWVDVEVEGREDAA